MCAQVKMQNRKIDRIYSPPAFYLEVQLESGKPHQCLLHNVDTEEYLVCETVIEALVEADQSMEIQKYPRGSSVPRTFDLKMQKQKGQENLCRKNAAVPHPVWEKKVKLMIHVTSRQYCSWQGYIVWMGQKVFYRSVMELLYLIQSALENGKLESHPVRRRRRKSDKKSDHVFINNTSTS